MKDRALRKAQKSPSGSLSEGDAVRFSYLPAAGASASPRDVAYHDDEEPGFAILILPLSEADPVAGCEEADSGPILLIRFRQYQSVVVTEVDGLLDGVVRASVLSKVEDDLFVGGAGGDADGLQESFARLRTARVVIATLQFVNEKSASILRAHVCVPLRRLTQLRVGLAGDVLTIPHIYDVCQSLGPEGVVRLSASAGEQGQRHHARKGKGNQLFQFHGRFLLCQVCGVLTVAYVSSAR